MRNCFYALFFLASLNSCLGSKLRFGGYKTFNGVENGYIKIDSGKNFTYERFSAMIRRETRGSWIQKGKFIVLNSEESLTNDNGTVSEYYDSTKKDYELRLQGFYSSHPLQNVKIIVNGSMLFRTDVEGKVKLNFAIKSLHVMSDHQFYYKVKNENANNFLVKTEGINVQLIHFQNDTIIIKGNKLVFKNETYVRR